MNRGWVVLLLCALPLAARKKDREPILSPADAYVAQAQGRAAEMPAPSAGSLWSGTSVLSDAVRDWRAGQVDDIITILVVERASAVTSGTVKTSRSSSTKNSVAALAGITKATGPLNNLAAMTGDTQLSGEGTTTRDVVLSTTMTARIAAVMPNGVMLVEGTKDVEINSERQRIVIRGLVRPPDIGPGNTVRSDHLAQLEVRVNGKGVIGDAVRRPFFLYRLLLGVLPF